MVQHSVKVVTVDFFASGTNTDDLFGFDIGSASVSTGSTYANNQATMLVNDNTGDLILEDSGDADQTLVQDLNAGSFSFTTGQNVQSESTYYVTFSDGAAGQIIALNISNVATGGAFNSTGFFVILKEDGSGDLGNYLPAEGETFTVNSRDGGGNVAYNIIACFSKRTLIRTKSGYVAVENLKAGDYVLSLDNTYHPIRWVGSRRFDAIDLAANPKLRPVRISAGALGEGTPERDLWVSRQHRVLVRSKIAQSMFGTGEVLVPAVKLVELDGIEIDTDLEEVEYYHILFDQHEVICSDGAWTESLFTGPEALKAVSPNARKEIETIFPEICVPDFTPEPARHIPQTGKHMKELAARHAKNNKPLFS